MNDLLMNAAAAGGTLLGSGAGIRLIVGSIKLFIKDVIPLLQKGNVPQPLVQPSIVHCKNHDNMDSTVQDIKNMGDTLVRIETKLERATEDRNFIIELSDRLHKAETAIEILKANKVVI